MSARMRLPARRAAETLTLEFAGLRYTVTIGHFPDGRLGEVFIANHKAGNASNTAVRDAGILLSLLLQHSCAAEVIADAVSRDGDGTPSGVTGAVLDLITRRGPTVKILGVDPGIHSGLAIVTLSDDAAPPLIAATGIPLTGIKQRVDAIALQNWITQHTSQDAYIERGQAMPQQPDTPYRAIRAIVLTPSPHHEGAHRGEAR